MRSILVVTESFHVGGLETHIKGEIAALSQRGCEVHLAVGKDYDRSFFPTDVKSITTDLPLGPDVPAAGLAEVVDRLRGLIREARIQCVHAHPFTSLVPSFIAAELERINFAMTLHGPASLGSYYGPLYDFLLNSVIIPEASLVVSVSQEVAELVRPFRSQARHVVIPNAIDTTRFDARGYPDAEDDRWLVVSRLDPFKIVGIADFIRKARKAGLPGVIVAGDGPSRIEFEDALAKQGFGQFVEFIGSKSDMPDLMASVAGVAGMGRVVLEGLASGKHVCLVGYDNVKGFVSRDLFQRAAFANFSGRYLPGISDEDFRSQLWSIQAGLGHDMLDSLGEQYAETVVWDRFITEVDQASPKATGLLSDCYRMLRAYDNDETGPFIRSARLHAYLGKLVNSQRHYRPELVAGYRHFSDMLENNNANSGVNQSMNADKPISVDMQAPKMADPEVLAGLNAGIPNGSPAVMTSAGANVQAGVQTAADQAGNESLGEELAARARLIAQQRGEIVRLRQEIAALYDKRAAQGKAERFAEDAAMQAQMAALKQQLAERDNDISRLTSELRERDAGMAAQDAEIERLRQEAAFLFRRIEALLSSKSWKITRPLRYARRLLAGGARTAVHAIYPLARSVSRYLPVSPATKARWKNRLIAYLHRDAAMAAAAATVPAPAQSLMSRVNEGLQHFGEMQPELCALEPDLVSVVLPVYNQAELIADSIDSVLAQTYENFELIVINDGSTDGVEEVLKRYLGHPKVRVYTQANQKLPKALSNGFSYARGEFWTWTSADNLMEPRMLELLVKRLRADPRLGLVYADYYAIDDRGELLHDPSWRAHNRPNPASGEIRLPRTTALLNTVQDNFIGPCFMYRGWIGRCMGDYDPQLGVEDYDYWMRINAFFPAAHLGTEDLLYRYRVHDNTLSANANEHRILEKVQRLMSYEKERAAFFAKDLAIAADEEAMAWLTHAGMRAGAAVALPAEGDIGALQADLVVVSSRTFEQRAAQLSDSRKLLAIIVGDDAFNYVSLSGVDPARTVVLAYDATMSRRVRLVSTCPVIDAMSTEALPGVLAFAKNACFRGMTRSEHELVRQLPQKLLQPHSQRVLLQVDDFIQGGLENVVVDLAVSLKEKGIPVTLAIFGKEGVAAAKARDQQLQVVSFGGWPGDEAYKAFLDENAFTVVNAHYSTRGAHCCADLGIPFVQTIHNSYVWFDPDSRSVYKAADQYTDLYICVSATAARYADVSLGLDVTKMLVVPNGINVESLEQDNFAANRRKLREHWNIADEDVVFLNVASIMATKAQVPMLEAFAKVVAVQPRAKLMLLGGSLEPAYKRLLDERIAAHGLADKVILAGYDSHVSKYYHGADVFVLPSFWEGWSLSLGEAVANGLPCVITDVGSAYEFYNNPGVEVIKPPFGDITRLNYTNLGEHIHARNAEFEAALVDSMLRAARKPRMKVAPELMKALDKRVAYSKYAACFDAFKKPSPVPEAGSEPEQQVALVSD